MSNWKTIEAVLRQHASVRDCIVLDRADVKGGQCLVAYIVWNRAEIAKMSELRSHIKTTLPDLEMPAKFVFRNSLPILSDGTVDRAALMEVDQPERILPQGYVAPRTPKEKLMARIWQKTLNLKDIGVYDDFFDIVRDSSLAMDIITSVRKAFAVHLPVRVLFADPSVAGMTAAILRHKAQWTKHRDLAERVSDLQLSRRQQARQQSSKN